MDPLNNASSPIPIHSSGEEAEAAFAHAEIKATAKIRIEVVFVILLIMTIPPHFTVTATAGHGYRSTGPPRSGGLRIRKDIETHSLPPGSLKALFFEMVPLKGLV
jgi:hypothetical protein